MTVLFVLSLLLTVLCCAVLSVLLGERAVSAKMDALRLNLHGERDQ
jgi:hypothetical protein